MPLARPVSVNELDEPGMVPTMVKEEVQPRSVRRMRKLAPGTSPLALIKRMAESVLPPPDSVSELATGGKLVLWFLASPAAPQAMSCRAKAAKMAAAWGVLLARLPSSSSAVRRRW